MSMSSIKRQTRGFHVEVVQCTSKKCTKKRDARAELLFWSLNLLVLLFFWSRRCGRRRSCLSSLLITTMTKMIMAKLETTIHSLHCIAGNSGHQDTRINVLDTNNTVKCDFWPKSFCRPWWIQKERSGQGIKLHFDLLAQKLDLDGFSSWKWSKKILFSNWMVTILPCPRLLEQFLGPEPKPSSLGWFSNFQWSSPEIPTWHWIRSESCTRSPRLVLHSARLSLSDW